MKNIIVICFLISGCLFQVTKLQAQQKKKVYTTQRTASALLIDGKLNDPAWEAVDWGGDFTQRIPIDSAAPSQKTAFKILYDDKFLYVGIQAFDTEPDKIIKRMSRRDGFEGDWVEVNIDSYHDLRSAFSFTATASGVKGDEAVSNNGDNWDSSWDPICYLKTNIDDQGWTAEYKIPLSQLRFADKPEHVWGLQVSRRLFRKEEISTWQFISKNAPGWVHLFGELHGIKGIKPQKQLEIQPYTVAKTETSVKQAGNPFADGHASNITGGVDGKIGITSDITLDFTVNPDFGQVEADPSQVNLSAFEVFFQERRPFFIESRNILDYQITSSVAGGSYTSDNLFYSRRIGRPPQYSPNLRTGEFADQPINSSILGAFKLTGKTHKGLSFALIESITDKEKAKIDFNGARRKEVVEPFTNYLAARVQQDLNKGNTIIGGVFTAVNRNISNPQLNFLNKSAYTGGLDFVHNWKNRKYFIAGDAIFSTVNGSPEAILNEQTSSQRFFQRPLKSYAKLDSSRTSLTGTGATFRGGRGGTGQFRFESGLTYRSPELELNDIGYLRNADQVSWWAWAGYQSPRPFGIFRNFNANVNGWSDWDFGGTNVYKAFNFNFNTQFKNYWRAGSGITPQSHSISNADLRGGPAIRYPAATGQWYFINTDNRKKLQINFEGNNTWGAGSYTKSNGFWLEVRYRPINAMAISIAPSYNTYNNELQYINTQKFNNQFRYLTGSLDQKTLSTTIRLDYTVTPNLSVQYYGQPFISKGIYNRFNQIVQPGAKVYADVFSVFTPSQIKYQNTDNRYVVDENTDGNPDYNFSNPDFNFVQFRSNLILRWEYIPGSTAFFVWSQNRTGNPAIDRVGFSSITNDLWDIKGSNVFLLKFTYRFIL